MILLDLWNSQVDLNKLLTSDSLDAFVTWRLSRLVSILSDLEKSRAELINKFGEQNGDGTVQVKSENIEDFTNQFTELLDEPLDDFQPIELEKLEGANLNALEMARLGWLIAPPDGS